MLCDICKMREAVMFIQQVSVQKTVELHVCAECAKQRQVISSKVCYSCGYKLEDIINKGMVGCPECYAAFKEEIRQFIVTRGGDLPYTGSMPKKLLHFRSVVTDRILIQTKLQKAVENEDFEKAAMYRDFLKALEQGSVEAGEYNE